MKRISRVIFAAVSIAALAGCSVRRSIRYYADHPHSRRHELQGCVRHESSNELADITLRNCQAAGASQAYSAGGAPPIPVN
jgi:hypothetical protein